MSLKTLRELVERSAPYLELVAGVDERWVARWRALAEKEREARRPYLDSWLALWLDAQALLAQPEPDAARAAEMAEHWPPALVHYADMCGGRASIPLDALEVG